MIARRHLLSAAASFFSAPALAQLTAETTVVTPQQAARPRAGAHRNDPLPLPPPAPPPVPPDLASRGEPAPVPDRDMEDPQSRNVQRATPQLNPALIDPDAPQTGTQRDTSSLRAREDRFLRQPAAGARLRLPFTY
ncbi:hypothetical protein [Neoroseomonas lacus]|uniref:Uncharacterized protein n=1 Tax=Neoroseomonas lacus TaxID=287609 RepID=A0A917KB33_9PROT|nr:hypothetical protein [Neoroseomonas lacus]GGJ03755.1 hypothetical protein GCM10011320_08450 [Neoroseomonas lacus]